MKKYMSYKELKGLISLMTKEQQCSSVTIRCNGEFFPIDRLVTVHGSDVLDDEQPVLINKYL